MAPKSRAQATANGAGSVRASPCPSTNAKSKPPRGSDASSANANPWLRRKQDDHVAHLAGMGFSTADARAALDKHVNLDQALDWLLSGAPGREDKEATNSSPAPTNSSLDGVCNETRSPDKDQVAFGVGLEELPTEAGSSRASDGSMTPLKHDHDWQELSVSETAFEGADQAAEGAGVQHAAKEPCTRLMRASQAWCEDVDSKVLGVNEGGFVRVWTHTKTEQGWVYAELENDSESAGWLPSAILQEAPSGCEWLRAVRTWHGVQGHMDVKEGCMLLCYTESRTELGWVYAISSEVKEFDDHVETEGRAVQAGWVPDYCVFQSTA